MVKSGQKDIELRLYDEKRQSVRVGDTLCFQNAANEREFLTATVVALHRFPSFEELYACLDLLRCGYTPETVRNAAATDMNAYYSPAQQARYGVVGIEIVLH